MTQNEKNIHHFVVDMRYRLTKGFFTCLLIVLKTHGGTSLVNFEGYVSMKHF